MINSIKGKLKFKRNLTKLPKNVNNLIKNYIKYKTGSINSLIKFINILNVWAIMRINKSKSLFMLQMCSIS